MINRKKYINKLDEVLKRSRIAGIIGPRQCGKTTLARTYAKGLPEENYFDLEDPISLTRLENPITELSELKDLVIIDEIQRRPELFPVLRVLSDRQPLPCKFLILGSASPELLRQSSESLAGRIEYIELSGFLLSEIKKKDASLRWLRGGYPLSFLAEKEKDSLVWRKSFIRNVAERDIPQLGIKVASTSIIRFWTMLAHYHGHLWNASEMARSLNVSENTARSYLDILTSTFFVRQLAPWHQNLKKRQVKSPKIYFRDTGLLHALLGITDKASLINHPKYGFSWEGEVIEEILMNVRHDECYFWRTHNGAELDLMLLHNGVIKGFEIKRSDAPKLTPSMKTALKDLNLDSLDVIYPGKREYKLDDKIMVKPFSDFVGLGVKPAMTGGSNLGC